MINKTFLGDCLEVMPSLSDKSIDMVLCDLPYGTLSCKWDIIIPFVPLWDNYKRIVKKDKAVALFASQPFSSALVMSNLPMFKYELIWDKKIPSGMCNAKIQPMRQHENILVFFTGNSWYNPQKSKRDTFIKSGGMSGSLSAGAKGLKRLATKTYEDKYPTTLLQFDKVRKGSLHPTQKPLDLIEYLIKTYTNEGDIVLDNCAGSGTTGIACLNTNRKYVLIEKEKENYEIIQKRLASQPDILGQRR